MRRIQTTNDIQRHSVFYGIAFWVILFQCAGVPNGACCLDVDRVSDPPCGLSRNKFTFVAHMFFCSIYKQILGLLTLLVYKPRLAASIVTFVALLRFSIVEPDSYILEPLSKPIGNRTLFCPRRLLAVGYREVAWREDAAAGAVPTSSVAYDKSCPC